MSRTTLAQRELTIARQAGRRAQQLGIPQQVDRLRQAEAQRTADALASIERFRSSPSAQAQALDLQRRLDRGEF